MAKGFENTGSDSSAWQSVRPEQILTYFGHEITASNKVICPFHKDTEPSMLVNQDYVYCFGCKQSFDTYWLAKSLLELTRNRKFSTLEMTEWINAVQLPDTTDRAYSASEYLGPVSDNLIDYWHNQLTDKHYATLAATRLLTKATVDLHRIGYRPDYNAWSIPFYNNETVQFRFCDPAHEPRYMSLAGHGKSAFVNADLLNDTQPYVVVFFGSLDGILARQEGLVAVGLNGSNVSKKNQQEIIDLFAKQSLVFVVPDNTQSEFKPAWQLARWIDAEVRFFPADLPKGFDFTDWMRSGRTALQFMQDVLGLYVSTNITDNLRELITCGDKYNLSKYHYNTLRGVPFYILAASVANGVSSMPQWGKIQRKLLAVKTEKDYNEAIEYSRQLQYAMKGGW